MTGQNPESLVLETSRSRQKRLLYAVILMAAVLAVVFLLKVLLFDRPTIDEKLAAIEAAHAIPDSENAARIYTELLQADTEGTLYDYPLDPNSYYSTVQKPWSSSDYPQLVDWLAENRETIAKLQKACDFEKCWFPIRPWGDAMQIANRLQSTSDLLMAVKKWAQLLVCSANNDIAEGRMDAALAKYLCVLRMGEHLRQQPEIVRYLVGIAVEALALKNIRSFVVQGTWPEKQLTSIEETLLKTKGNWREELEAAIEVDRLLGKKMMKEAGPFWEWRVRMSRMFEAVERARKQFKELSCRFQADRQGTLILIALKRYKDKTGRWPNSLEEIKHLVAEEILVDPSNNSSFIYKLTGDTFRLYSKGTNNIDEDGELTAGPNGGGADDWLIWPPRSRETKQEKVNGE